ncbi:MAG: protease inhibitor I42 family protein [candidate division Zixibacteria bacterium]|nr:protease inhibitor I42 family protein [candidate division Zixibacteria bacterium]
MNRIMKTFILSAVLLTFIADCSSKNATIKVDPDQSSAQKAVTIQLTAKDDGGNVRLEADRILSIDLDANPSTGYRWEITEIDEEVLAIESRDYKQRDAEPGMVGVGGTLTLNFKTIAAGKTILKMVYTRPQSGDDDVAKSFSVNVDVR